ncbi:2-C-methyl-D-erythritol 2,4-cyclodiphosphate synthase [Ornithinimicrobium sp. INDO-MA30-4]|uniref:2-C-methyl-D-erythritol 2,4-cyclodiphosphate synthase n=1 Tax=Ornithinimicrobium sp. INDO-MA30-4 TaxID=2908651 RepID=UPI001F18C2E2|nr:2-C-methyl-D-erythritol 2,4-cyclodiphosphate synthase [Ornithinimicrobium sp. INDO-MA30-4]UJH69620.1 2-C-methyl-D-erythritol 2,4-cyclodiphosphate synthase [Ornithinimicrobium sp. INDO-MA30-4]
MQPLVRVGQGFDVHPFAEEARPLLLGGHLVDETAGLAGHSDADIVAHAVTDALLGALALGDLGSFVGVDTPEVAGAESMGFVAAALREVSDAGYGVANVDVTVIAQRPRIGPHVLAIRQGLAKVLACDISQISVKATTTDKLGSIGGGEGIACLANATLERGFGQPAP